MVEDEKAKKNKIPKGDYCYSTPEDGVYMPCPYWGRKNCNGVEIPWCSYMDAGGFPNSVDEYDGWEDQDEADEILKAFFGDEYETKTDMFLLFDQVKECGENLYDKKHN